MNYNDVMKRAFERISQLREEGKLPPINPDDWHDEPTALAFTPNDQFYFSDEVVKYSEDEVRTLIIKALTHNDYNLCGSLATRDLEIREANFNIWFEANKK